MNYRQQMDNIAVHIGTITKIYHEFAKLQGLTYNTMMVLEALRQSQPCTQKQISEEWGLPKQSVNSVIKDFAKKEYIELLAGRNKKEKLIAFTEKGKTFADSTLQPSLAMEERVLQRIGEKESRQFENTTAKFAQFFQEEFSAHQQSNSFSNI
ncbi:MAG: hypothetical protein CSA42_00590, partial [Gammaproteobacteria bacterium]